MKMMKRFITHLNYHLVGTVNLFLTGFINYMVLVLNILVRFVVIMYIWVERLSINISKSGDMHKVCDPWVFLILVNSMKLQRLMMSLLVSCYKNVCMYLY